MTQSTPEPVPGGGFGHAPADEQETVRLDQPDPDATRPMSLAELRELDAD